MSLVSRFFNSIDDDRPYDATDWATYFAALITKGVCHEEDMAVTADGSASAGYAGVVTVGLGMLIVRGYMAEIANAQEALNVPLNATGTRPDLVIVQLDMLARQFNLLYRTGSVVNYEGVEPALVNNENIAELALARVDVPAGATAITQDMVTDLRMNNDYCGIASLRWDDNNDVRRFFDGWSQRMNVLYTSIHSALTENQAAYLQAEIDNLNPYDQAFTLRASGWTADGAGAYIQTYYFEALDETTKCQVDLDMSGATAATADTLEDEYSKIRRAACSSGAVTFTCYGEPPAVDLPMILRVNMYIDMGA